MNLNYPNGKHPSEEVPGEMHNSRLSGEYEIRHILHTLQEGEQVYVFENVSAEVCDVCSDTLLAPDTIKSMEQRLRQKKQPSRMVPVLDYA
jgi:YgiT-type zinc finger domain-containing protein